MALEDIVVEHDEHTYRMGVREEDGKIFTTMPDNLQLLESPSDIYEVIKKLRDAFKPPEEAIVNNMEYNSRNAELFKENFFPKELETLYYMSLGYNNKAIAQNMKISKNTVKTNIIRLYGKFRFPNHGNKRVLTTMDYQKALPHLFPMRQYDPIELTNRQYEVARMIAEGRTRADIAEELVIGDTTVHTHTNDIYNRVRDQLPPGYVLQVHIVNLFSSGAFYSKSNPTDVR